MNIAPVRLVPLTVLAVVLSWSLQGTPARAQADLSVTKTVSAPSAVEGPELTYTITLTNNGPADAGNASILDIMSTGNTFVSARIGPGSSTITSTSGSVLVNFGTLVAGQSASVVLDVVPLVIAEGHLLVTAPASIAGDNLAGLPAFGPALTPDGLSGVVAAAEPALACGALTNPAAVAGRSR